MLFRDRFYSPDIGRFLSQDLRSIVSGNSYEYNGNWPFHVSESAIAVGPTLYTLLCFQGFLTSLATGCGGYEWIMRFKLNPKAEQEGFWIQQVDSRKTIIDCILNKETQEIATFWEAFPMSSLITDRYFSTGSGTCTKGDAIIRGRCAFYAIDKEGLKQRGFKQPNRLCTHTTALCTVNGPIPPLPSPSSNVVQHDLTVRWNCCAGVVQKSQWTDEVCS